MEYFVNLIRLNVIYLMYKVNLLKKVDFIHKIISWEEIEVRNASQEKKRLCWSL